VRVPELTGFRGPVAVDDWLLDDLGLIDSGVTLREAAHVMAVLWARTPGRSGSNGSCSPMPRCHPAAGGAGSAVSVSRAFELPPDKEQLHRRAVRPEWPAIAYLLSAIACSMCPSAARRRSRPRGSRTCSA